MDDIDPLSIDHDQYPVGYIADILRSAKTFALVGASDNDVRPSYFVAKYLMEKGYDVYPINPGKAGRDVCGRTILASMDDIPVPIDVVDIFRSAAAADGIVDDAIKLNPLPKVIWMQLGVRNDAAARRAAERGVQVVMNRCPKMEYGKISGEWSWIGGFSGRISSKKQKLHDSGKFQSLGIAPRR